MRSFTFATRASMLALAQSRALVRQIEEAHGGAVSFKELQVVTEGDRIVDRPLSEIGGKGLFVKEIEQALLDRRADLAVHSLKDMPSLLPGGLALACVPLRADPRDAFLSVHHAHWSELPKGAKVGTSSLRRRVALSRLRPDLNLVDLRGNVDTRIRKLEQGDVDAIVLAAAGLARLGLTARVRAFLSPEESLPAVGQGALAIEAREGDREIGPILRAVHDDDTARAVSAERGVLAALGADCKTPLGAFAVKDGGAMWLRAFLAEPDGKDHRAEETRVAWPDSDAHARDLGIDLGRRLQSRG